MTSTNQHRNKFILNQFLQNCHHFHAIASHLVHVIQWSKQMALNVLLWVTHYSKFQCFLMFDSGEHDIYLVGEKNL